jgi:late competence protein required for DNA uptake (superfamily II DNA/RNA helicase)
MKRAHLTLGISLLACSLLFGITHADSPTTRPTQTEELSDMRDKMMDLLKQNTVLGRQVSTLKLEVARLQAENTKLAQQQTLLKAPLNQVPQTLPLGAVPHLFNGTTYYTIPVNAVQP